MVAVAQRARSIAGGRLLNDVMSTGCLRGGKDQRTNSISAGVFDACVVAPGESMRRARNSPLTPPLATRSISAAIRYNKVVTLPVRSTLWSALCLTELMSPADKAVRADTPKL